MLLLGVGFGYGLSTVSKLPARQSRTVALETNIQNSTLTLTIIEFSFSDRPKLRDELIVFPLLYSFFLVVYSLVLVLLFRWLSNKEKEEEEDESVLSLEETVSPGEKADAVTNSHNSDNTHSAAPKTAKPSS